MKVDANVVGVLLAGGRSSRMGGGDKCLQPLGGRPVLAEIVARLKPQVSRMVLNANGDPSRFAAFGLPVVADRIGDFAGPLAGVHAGLEWAKTNVPGSRFAVTVATDTPFFPRDLVRCFFAALEDAPKLLIARTEDGTHPVIGLWPMRLAGELAVSVKGGALKVGAWVAEHGAGEVFFPPVEIASEKVDPFFNINRPEDLARADALLRGVRA
jgi:molybdopterin-guanine dinucleotide biosynthesis protein A